MECNEKQSLAFNVADPKGLGQPNQFLVPLSTDLPSCEQEQLLVLQRTHTPVKDQDHSQGSINTHSTECEQEALLIPGKAETNVITPELLSLSEEKQFLLFVPWNTLPDLVMGEIYGYLDACDRLAAGSVCSKWRDSLFCPSIWRNIQVQVDNDHSNKCDPRLSIVKPLVLQLSTQFGKYFRRLELIWPRPCRYPHAYSTRLNHKAHSKAANNFFHQLLMCQVQLNEVILKDWIHNYRWKSRTKIMKLLENFLRYQYSLERLSFQNACFEIKEVLHLLSALVSNSDSLTKHLPLKHLDLRNTFREWSTITVNSQYLQMFDHMTSLTSLYLDYTFLCDTTLTMLAELNCGTLVVLRVDVRDTDDREQHTTDKAWKRLAKVCPKLQVGFNIVNVAHHDEINPILRRSIPLYSFRLTCGRTWDQTKTRNYRSTLNLLLAYYTNTLEDVQFHLKNNLEQIDDLLLELINKCNNLENLQFDGVIKSMDTIRELCLMQVSNNTKFKTIHVRPRNMNHTSCQILGDICTNFLQPLAEMDVDFKIDNAPSVMMFT